MNTNQIEQAQALLKKQAAKRVVKAADRMVAAGAAEWIRDPEVSGVVGLVRTGTRRALVVVYLQDGDFEVDDDFEAGLWSSHSV